MAISCPPSRRCRAAPLPATQLNGPCRRQGYKWVLPPLFEPFSRFSRGHLNARHIQPDAMGRRTATHPRWWWSPRGWLRRSPARRAGWRRSCGGMSQEALVGVKCSVKREWPASQAVTSDGSVVHIAPPPGLPRLQRAHDRVRGGPEVCRRVAMPRRVAAADVPAREAEPEVDPALAQTEALLATSGARGHIEDQLQVPAGHHH